MNDLIRIRRGLKEKLPELQLGELGYCYDTNQLFLGTPTGNKDLTGKITSDISDIFNDVDDLYDGKLNDNTITSSKLKTDTQDDKIKLINLNEEVLDAITGEASIQSIPQDGSVTHEKLSESLSSELAQTAQLLDDITIEEGSDWNE